MKPRLNRVQKQLALGWSLGWKEGVLLKTKVPKVFLLDPSQRIPLKEQASVGI